MILIRIDAAAVQVSSDKAAGRARGTVRCRRYSWCSSRPEASAAARCRIAGTRRRPSLAWPARPAGCLNQFCVVYRILALNRNGWSVVSSDLVGFDEQVWPNRDQRFGPGERAVHLQAVRSALGALHLQRVVPGVARGRVRHGDRAELRERPQSIDQSVAGGVARIGRDGSHARDDRRRCRWWSPAADCPPALV